MVVYLLAAPLLAEAEGRPAHDPRPRLLRWPLSATEHPELSPHYPIAKTLAEPGVDWVALCERGAHKRNIRRLADQTAYLRAWCSAGQRDVRTALEQLRPLLRSSVRSMAASVRVDLANILVAEGSADRARHLLADARIDDLAVIDRLAALFADLGQLTDAAELNDLALASNVRSSQGDKCMRQARRHVMDSQPEHRVARSRFLHFTGRDPTCASLERELTCWLAAECGDYYRGTNDDRVAAIYDLRNSWGTRTSLVRAQLETVAAAAKTRREQDALIDVVLALIQQESCAPTHPEDLASLTTAVYGNAAIPSELRAQVWDARAHSLCTASPP